MIVKKEITKTKRNDLFRLLYNAYVKTEAKKVPDCASMRCMYFKSICLCDISTHQHIESASLSLFLSHSLFYYRRWFSIVWANQIQLKHCVHTVPAAAAEASTTEK